MAIPNLTPLPDPPLPTDAEATFDAKAGASLLAQQEMVEQLNASTIPGINQAVTAAESARDAAASSATAAAGSVTAAAQQVSLATEQKGLAVTARQGSEDARDQAQIYASAAGSAAGLPALVGNARKVLGVTPDESGVGWVDGLPDMTGNGGKVLQVNQAGTQAQWVLLGSCLVVDEKSSGTQGGSATTGSYFTRTLNTVRHDTIGATLSGNALTLPAGTYLITAVAPAQNSSFHKARLYDQTNSAVLATGTSENTAASNILTRSIVTKLLQIASPTAIRLEHRVTSNGAGAATLGNASSFGDVEVYSEMLIQKVQ